MADAALPASDAITNVEKITKNLSTARDGIGKILSTDPSSALTTIQQYRDAVSGEASAVRAFKRDEKYTEKEQQMLCEAYSETSRVHTDLLDVLDAQKDSIRPTPFAGTLTSLLRNDKNAAKALNFAILDLAPTCKDSLSKELDAQQKRLDEVFRAYDEA